MNDFLSSPFSPAMPMGNTSLAAGENTSLTLDKRESLLKSKFLRHRLKNFCFTGDCFFIEYVLR